MSIDQITDKVMDFDENSKIMILAPLINGQKGSHEKLFLKIKKDGFARVRVDHKIYLMDELPKLEKNKKHTIDAVVDRLIIKKGIEKRLSDSLELALALSQRRVTILEDPGRGSDWCAEL